MSRAYYNENDKFAADWLRELILEGLIAPGDVDVRSILEVTPADLAGYTQCHFFAGIGGWSLAARLAGWSDSRVLWTGSCPCQPFSVAGKQGGTADARHLWPEFARLIAECQPPVVFGEQVASTAGRDWLAGVRADLEGMGYGVGAADLCAASVGAPHIRQRLWWVGERVALPGCQPAGRGLLGPGEGADPSGLRAPGQPERSGGAGGVADDDEGLEGCGGHVPQHGAEGRTEPHGHSGPSGDNPWASAIWHPCLDGKARRIPAEPGLFPLADGLPGRVGLLRGAGNAIVPQVGALFLQAYLDGSGHA